MKRLLVAVIAIVTLFLAACAQETEKQVQTTPTPVPQPNIPDEAGLVPLPLGPDWNEFGIEPPPASTPSPIATPTPSPAPPSIVPPPGTIVAALSDFNSDIYTVTPDGGLAVRVTGTPGHIEGGPIWSPDGKRLAFIRHPLFEGNADELVVVNADGSDPLTLAGPMRIFSVAWLPDGQQIAFLELTEPFNYYKGLDRCHETKPPRLFVADLALATVSLIQEVKAPDGCAIIGQLQWSPDGKKIAIASRGLYLVDVAEHRLTEIVPLRGDIYVHQASWSPDGQRLALEIKQRNRRNVRMMVVGFEGNGLTEIVRRKGEKDIYDLAWSPEGSLIAFVAQIRRDTSKLFVVKPDGSGRRSLAKGAGGNFAWSPDGCRIAFTMAGEDSQDDVYVVEVDGGDPVRITDHLAEERSLAWSPDGDAIAFVSGRDNEGGIYAFHPDGARTALVPTYDREHGVCSGG